MFRWCSSSGSCCYLTRPRTKRRESVSIMSEKVWLFACWDVGWKSLVQSSVERDELELLLAMLGQHVLNVDNDMWLWKIGNGKVEYSVKCALACKITLTGLQVIQRFYGVKWQSRRLTASFEGPVSGLCSSKKFK
ncbi:hypothetical protein HanHA300_Chr01g0018771 [Helianthus annuus]|nr:hypothetical protein HanHA300_Chr01g0018771 [Helianthus annuus]KAJ0627020.1 hypothetical protein HanHA89_Chr01g0020611 [Helianthus annuus]